MEMLELIKTRRSIRKYADQQVPRDALEKILEAGSYAPNAGGAQRTLLVGVRDPKTVEALGKLNLAGFDRSRLMGPKVSAEQPSIIDDPGMKSALYGAPAVCVVFALKDFLYSTPDAFCCADHMALAAHSMGISSCIVARGEETFASEEGRELLGRWQIPDDYLARCFVTFGYCEGAYPAVKPRKPDRCRIVEG